MEKNNYSRIYRFIHWAIAISFVLLLITIFLRLTWMNKNNMAAIIQEYLKGTDQVLTQDQTIAIAKKIRQPMWNWHIYMGYVLLGLFSLRFILPAFGQMKIKSPLSKSLSIKTKFQNWTYIVFYICVITSLTTGVLMEWGPKEFEKPAENIHVLGIYYLIAFIVIHITGVLIAEFTNQKGIISRIVSGSEENI